MDSTADLLGLYIKFILPTYSHLIFLFFLYPFYIHSITYNVLLWKVRFNELFNAMASWGTNCCILTVSGSFILGWASLCELRGSREEWSRYHFNPFALSNRHSHHALHLGQPSSETKFLLPEAIFNTLHWETAPPSCQHTTFKAPFPKFLNFWNFTSYCHMTVVPSARSAKTQVQRESQKWSQCRSTSAIKTEGKNWDSSAWKREGYGKTL